MTAPAAPPHPLLPTAGSRARAWAGSLLRDHGAFRLLWHNWAEVIPGRLYRSNHPTPAQLAARARRHGLKTIINLRGTKPCSSTTLSRDAASRLGLVTVDLAFESRGAPHRDRVLRFAELWQRIELPALLHCKSGADRAGLVAGVALLLEGGTAAAALDQLSWRFGHVRRSRTGVLDAFFIRYAAEAEGRLGFIEWVAGEYDEAALRRDFVAGGLAGFLNDRVLRRE